MGLLGKFLGDLRGFLGKPESPLPEEGAGRGSSMPASWPQDQGKAKQVLNFLWLNLDVPAKPDPEDGAIRQPLPEKYIGNVRRAGRKQPQADIVLWVDSKRLTEKQYAYLKAAVEKDRPNVRLKDLRHIRAYKKEKLFNLPEKNRNWRSDKQTMIWRQVDAAKVLVSLQGDYDQTFFADLDYSHLDIGGKKAQDMLKKRGLLIGSGSESRSGFENQLWGFTRSRRYFFEESYDLALKSAYKGRNAWSDFVGKIRKDLTKKEKLADSEIAFPISHDGSQAKQPGHKWKDENRVGKPQTVPSRRLSAVFGGKKDRRMTRKGKDAFRSAAPPPPSALPADTALPPVTGSRNSVVPLLLAKGARP